MTGLITEVTVIPKVRKEGNAGLPALAGEEVLPLPAKASSPSPVAGLEALAGKE